MTETKEIFARADRAAKAGCKVGHSKWIYFIGGTEGPIKIGIANDVRERLRAIQSCSPIKLTILGARPGGFDLERAYHLLFDEVRAHGEWFHRSADLMAEIARWPAPSRGQAARYRAEERQRLMWRQDGAAERQRWMRQQAVEQGW